MKLQINWKGAIYYFGIKYDGFHRKVCWIYGYKNKKEGDLIRSSNYSIEVNPYQRWKHKIVWEYQFYRLKKNNELYKQCQGCGMGISKYRIRDPNYGEGNKRFNCCVGCFCFYDWRCSSIEIVDWKNKKPICKKRVS